jgi:hypothetical protein
MTEDAGYDHAIPEKNKKYFRDREPTENPDDLDKYPHTRRVFERELTDEQLDLLNRLGKALEQDLHTEGGSDAQDADDDPAVKLKGYVFVVH